MRPLIASTAHGVEIVEGPLSADAGYNLAQSIMPSGDRYVGAAAWRQVDAGLTGRMYDRNISVPFDSAGRIRAKIQQQESRKTVTRFAPVHRSRFAPSLLEAVGKPLAVIAKSGTAHCNIVFGAALAAPCDAV